MCTYCWSVVIFSFSIFIFQTVSYKNFLKVNKTIESINRIYKLMTRQKWINQITLKYTSLSISVSSLSISIFLCLSLSLSPLFRPFSLSLSSPLVPFLFLSLPPFFHIFVFLSPFCMLSLFRLSMFPYSSWAEHKVTPQIHWKWYFKIDELINV